MTSVPPALDDHGRGRPLLEELPQFLYKLGVRSIEVASFELPSPVRRRVPKMAQQAFGTEISDALHMHAVSGIPFWESVLLSLYRLRRRAGAQRAVELILRSAAYHQTPKSARHIAVGANLPVDIHRIEQSLGANQILTVLSSVTTLSGDVRQLAMLDFRIPASPQAEAIALHVARGLIPGGMLVHSGASYHLYGAVLLDADQFSEFLGRALLLHPVVDGRWIAHQQIEGRCALRISAGQNGVPSVIADL